jgi:hypothetical protein
MRNFGGEWWIRDLGSTNGLHLGAHRVQQHRLAPGDRLLLAPDVAIRFLGEAATAMPAGAEPHTPASALPPGIPAPAGPTVRYTPANPVRSTAGPAPAGTLPPGPLVSGGDAHDAYRRTMPAQLNPVSSVTLHICQTCGRRTAPDVELCYACHQSIARPCDTCHASLLPIQDRCPRCQTPNPASVHRVVRRTGI